MLKNLTFLFLVAYALAVESLSTAQQPLATSYRFGYNDGQSTRSETRDLAGTVLGSYSYVGPDGVVRTTQYTAGTDGYRVIPPTSTTGEAAVTTTTQGVATPTTSTVPQTTYQYLPSVPTLTYNSILPSQAPTRYTFRYPTTQYTTGYQVPTTYFPSGYQIPTSQYSANYQYPTSQYSANYQYPTAQFYSGYQSPSQYYTGYQTPTTYYAAAYKVPTTGYSADPAPTNTQYSSGFRQLYP